MLVPWPILSYQKDVIDHGVRKGFTQSTFMSQCKLALACHLDSSKQMAIYYIVSGTCNRSCLHHYTQLNPMCALSCGKMHNKDRRIHFHTCFVPRLIFSVLPSDLHLKSFLPDQWKIKMTFLRLKKINY